MGKLKENPRYGIVSLRVNDAEKKQLETAAKKSKKTIGDVMRARIFPSKESA